MALFKILKAPMKLFSKDVITFVTIRRYDQGTIDDRLRYIAVKPTASISVLREKIWHLLDLPDYCEEVIILKSGDDVVIALTELRNGNDPQHPYILEVWPPRNRFKSAAAIQNKMLTIEEGDKPDYTNYDDATTTVNDSLYEPKHSDDPLQLNCSVSTITNDSMLFNKGPTIRDDKKMGNILSDFKHDLTYPIPSCTLFRRKSRDNFTNIFLKIQNDLTNLNMKLSSLETRIPM